jgi:hypothetical protein
MNKVNAALMTNRTAALFNIIASDHLLPPAMKGQILHPMRNMHHLNPKRPRKASLESAQSIMGDWVGCDRRARLVHVVKAARPAVAPYLAVVLS